MVLSGKVAIVTGGGGGFGEGIARAYAEQGAKVAVVDYNAEAAQRVAKSIGAGAIAVQADVGVRADVDRAVKDIISALGTPDILVNNAGTTHVNGSMLDVDEETFDRVFRVNVKSIYLFAKAVVPAMRERGGSILNIGSVSAIRPRPGLVWYNGSKGAVTLITKSMAVELAPAKIRVNVLCPVMAATGLLESFMGKPDTPENRKLFVPTIPMGRFCEASDVAAAAVFLASDAASFITGIEMPIDGGRSV
jgi:3-oxoacyl-[acyl-carrier protein] reductase